MEDKIILAGGCFWCTEAVFSLLEGVKQITPGYIGGLTPNPTYKEVCTGTTNHAEAIEVIFDSSVLSVIEILQVFFATHDPTTLNRQGGDVGTQYRSAIFYNSESQKELVKEYMDYLTQERVFENPIVTELAPMSVFYKAEQEHMDYYANHPTQAFCSMVIAPKLEKVHKHFAEKIKKA